MNHNDIVSIRNRMQILVGAQWFIVGRAAAMAWFGFLINDSDYALHLQSGFRVRTKEKVLIANLDMFDPTEAVQKSPSFDWDTYDWDIQGANCYDKWAEKFRKETREGIVREVRISDLGDLTIEIDNGMIIEVFINSSTKECWRFFKRESDDHLVVTGTGLEADECEA